MVGHQQNRIFMEELGNANPPVIEDANSSFCANFGTQFANII